MKNPIQGMEIHYSRKWPFAPWLVYVDRSYNVRAYGNISVHSIGRVYRAMLKLAEGNDEPEE